MTGESNNKLRDRVHVHTIKSTFVVRKLKWLQRVIKFCFTAYLVEEVYSSELEPEALEQKNPGSMPDG